MVKILIVARGVVKENDQKNIEQQILLLLGEDCRIEWEFTKEIPRTAQGKYRYVRSLVYR